MQKIKHNTKKRNHKNSKNSKNSTNSKINLKGGGNLNFCDYKLNTKSKTNPKIKKKVNFKNLTKKSKKQKANGKSHYKGRRDLNLDYNKYFN